MIFISLHNTPISNIERFIKIKKEQEEEEERKCFSNTKTVGKQLKIDEVNRLIMVASQCKTRYISSDFSVFRFNQIIKCELLESGNNIASGGVGRAAIGAMAFGGVGALVGAATAGRKKTCDSLEIKLTIKDATVGSFYMSFLPYGLAVKNGSSMYKSCFNNAQNVLSELDIIMDTQRRKLATENSPCLDVVGEIRKYKELFDDRIITEEEFRNKKEKLLK